MEHIKEFHSTNSTLRLSPSQTHYRNTLPESVDKMMVHQKSNSKLDNEKCNSKDSHVLPPLVTNQHDDNLFYPVLPYKKRKSQAIKEKKIVPQKIKKEIGQSFRIGFFIEGIEDDHNSTAKKSLFPPVNRVQWHVGGQITGNNTMNPYLEEKK